MREIWGTSLRFMMVVGLVCASSVAHADFVRMQMDDEYLGVTVRLTDFAELQPSLLDPDLPPRPQVGPFYEVPLPRSPGSRLDSLFMPTWDTYAASSSGRRIGDIDLTSLLADAPAMFGHFYGGGMRLSGMFDYAPVSFGFFAFDDIPLAGRTGRTHVGENNKALTQDRVYVRYNHYHGVSNVSALTSTGGEMSGEIRGFHLDTYTLAAEKTFCGGIWSLEARLPLAGQMHFATDGLSVTGGNLGNLALILKRMIYLTDRSSAVAGIGVDVPTGSAARGNAVVADYSIHNDAVHLLPYLGFLHASENRFFMNGFAQLDLPLNRQRFSAREPFFGDIGKFTEQTLLHLDLSIGRWLQRDPEAAFLTGLAFLTELHYTTTLNDGDSLRLWAGNAIFDLDSPANRTDLLNLTIGLHTEWRNNTLLRVGSVFPLRTGTDRTFDSELQVQLERRF
ncbi:MAG: hypothetical protein EA424_11875 [Planctomycetaceae bacterium]|nr:MAG: hypothetical protein EA424_11875 [Planctomycetaceae bacterium]